jgi:hypothetical protein
MMPTEFERHGGCGSFKKWKKSILVRDALRLAAVQNSSAGCCNVTYASVTY